MRLKLIIALVEDDKTDAVIDAARASGATGATVITSGRGEGLRPEKTFFGLGLESRRDVIMFLVVETRARGHTGAYPGRGKLRDGTRGRHRVPG